MSVGPVKPNAAISAGASGFALALGALMPKIAAPSTAPQGEAAGAAVLVPERQDGAEGGKELPDAVLGLDGKSEEQADAGTESADDGKDGEDAPASPFAWFATAPILVPEAKPEIKPEAALSVAVDAGSKPRTAPAIVLPEVEGAPVVEAKPVAAAAKVVVAAPATPEIKPVVGRAAPRQPKIVENDAPVDRETDVIATEAVANATTVETAAPAPKAVIAQAPRELRQAAAEAPVVRITVDRPAPSGPVSIADVTQGQREAIAPLAEAAAPAAFDLPQPRTTNAASDPQLDLSTLAAPTTGTQTVAAVAAMAQGDGGTLDTRHQAWTSQMIDKIEALRDAAPLRETKISLMPEGLGKLDISIRQDDAGMHVAFNTDTQAARQLITDAQPKLAEIAQERGVRIVSSSVESNATGTGSGSSSSASNSQMNQGQRQDAAPNRHQPSAPPSARRGPQTSTTDDERVA
jgi:flagellar hook-length control protein FliK